MLCTGAYARMKLEENGYAIEDASECMLVYHRHLCSCCVPDVFG